MTEEKKSGRPRNDRPVRKDAVDCQEVRNPDGKLVWAEKGLNPDNLPQTIWPFSKTLADQICSKIIEGYTLKKVAEEKGFPPIHIIHYWLRYHPEFRQAIDECRRIRADYYHDMAIEVTEKVRKKSQVAPARLRLDAYKWAATVGNSSRYGNSTTLKGDPESPVKIVICTGVPDSDDDIKSD